MAAEKTIDALAAYFPPIEECHARFGACNLDTDNDAIDYQGAIRGR